MSLGRGSPRPGCGELGVPAEQAAPRESCCPGASSAPAQLGAGGTVPARPWVLPAGRTWPRGPLPFPTPRCAPGRMGEPELSAFPSPAPSCFPG